MSRIPLPTENELVSRHRRGQVAFPPFDLAWEETRAKEIDGVLRATWQKKSLRFAAECRRQSNPKAVSEAAAAARRSAQAARLRPLVVLPYLDEAALDRLEAESVSGIDLCGNGVVIVPGEWYVRRTGNPNLFRAEGTIKNVYRGASSQVARLFLVRPEFASVQDALDELVRRGGRVALATVSKVCKRLEEELIVERKRGGGDAGSGLVQPEKLLDRGARRELPLPGRRRRGSPASSAGSSVARSRALRRQWAEKTG